MISFISCFFLNKDKYADRIRIINLIGEISEIDEIIYIKNPLIPKEYLKEMGEESSMMFLILEKKKTNFELYNLKKMLMELEIKYSINGRRIFNLNPGYINKAGVYAISHKSNLKRKRINFIGDTWTEKQLDLIQGKLMVRINTFHEFKECIEKFEELIENSNFLINKINYK